MNRNKLILQIRIQEGKPFDVLRILGKKLKTHAILIHIFRSVDFERFLIK